MRISLEKWISDADALCLLRDLIASQTTLNLAEIESRIDEYYIALVGELFNALRTGSESPEELARLGNAFSQFCSRGNSMCDGISLNDSAMFAATAYYCGGFPASAYISLKPFSPYEFQSEDAKICFDLLVRPKKLSSQNITIVRNALLSGDQQVIEDILQIQKERTQEALQIGANEWIASRMAEALLDRFLKSNIRTILPNGYHKSWNPLVASFISRSPSIWEFFPSQIEAIESGILNHTESFSIQMPTGAGKTALCETLLFRHATQSPDAVAIFLVPYRSLASELRNSLVKRLNIMGIPSRCAYASTIPAADEVSALEMTKIMVATPEALSGLLSADRDFFNRISLVICDEGHLLDSGDRGINLELLLARFRSRDIGAPRFVFMSAIVPNIDEINAWLGGTQNSVVKSTYRPAIAEYAKLLPVGRGAQLNINLRMHPHLKPPIQYDIEGFLSSIEFSYENPQTGRSKNYPHKSIKTQTVAIARKTMPLGLSAIFAANKSGVSGAIGIAQEVIKQLEHGLPLPRPNDYANNDSVREVIEYIELEYGTDWICCKALKAGFILHHGDIPQETRESFENILRLNRVQLVVCTSTLAEGVNLPIRTLVLYSTRRMTSRGRPTNLLTRDIKNLVGRAGRPGSTIRGLVVCANPKDWSSVHKVAQQVTEEPVHGALFKLINSLSEHLAASPGIALSNKILESGESFRALIDGIDSTLIDLVAEEIGQSKLQQIAESVVKDTFAFDRLGCGAKEILREVFLLRSEKVSSAQTTNRLYWIKSTGIKMRLVDKVEKKLVPRVDDWSQCEFPLCGEVLESLLAWTFELKEVQKSLRNAFRIEDASSIKTKEQIIALVTAWLSGASWKTISSLTKLSIDTALRVHSGAIAYAFQTNIEQGITILGKLLCEDEKTLANAIEEFPKQLRFGTQSRSGCLLAESGVRYRSAYTTLGQKLDMTMQIFDPQFAIESAYSILTDPNESLEEVLGSLVYRQTIKDLKSRLN